MAPCHALDDPGSSFTFVWCPGYVVVEDNEEADAATRHVAESPEVDAIAIRPDDTKAAVTVSLLTCGSCCRIHQSKFSAAKESVRKWQTAVDRSRRTSPECELGTRT